MNIVIRNYLSGSFLLQSEPNQWDAIVILNSKTKPSKFISEKTPRHLILKFDDICTQHYGKTEPALSHIQSALEFADQSDNLMVCCRAGQSRSAALAYILSYHYMGEQLALQMLNPKRHIPNKLLIDLASHLDQGEKLIASFLNWTEQHKQVRLSEYYDEIEAEYDDLENRGAINMIVDNESL